MAKKAEVSVLIRAKDLTASVIGKFRRRFRALTTTIKSVTRGMLAFAVATTAALVGLTKLGQQGDKVIAVKATFARITDNETVALNRLRAASRGTVEDFKLMSLHNQSLALGAAKTTEEFAAQIKVVRILARAQGLAVSEGLERFTVGMARLSSLRLDDLGIQVRQAEADEQYRIQLGLGTRALTEAEKATAFRNEAMRQAISLAETMTGKENAGAEATNRFATAMKNLKDKIAIVVAESPLVAEMFDRMTTVVADLIDILNGDAPLLKEAFASLGRLAGDAFAIALAQSIRTPLQMIGDMIAGKIPGGSFGPTDQAPPRLFDATIENALTRMGEELSNIADLATKARLIAEGRGGGGAAVRFGSGGGAGGPATISDIERREAFGLFGPESLASFRGRQAIRSSDARRQGNITRARLSPQGAPQVFDVGPTVSGDGLSGLGTIDAAAESIEDAGEVAAAAMFGVAQVIASESEDIARSLTSMITQILQSLPGVGGFASVLIGGIGGLASALLSKRQPQAVRVEDYSSRALSKLKRNSGEPIHITTIIEQGGVEIDRIERELFDRQNRDEVVRFGRTFVGGR